MHKTGNSWRVMLLLIMKYLQKKKGWGRYLLLRAVEAVTLEMAKGTHLPHLYGSDKRTKRETSSCIWAVRNYKIGQCRVIHPNQFRQVPHFRNLRHRPIPV